MQDSAPPPIADYGGGTTIRIYVSPRSSMNNVAGLHSGEIKISLTAPPVDGAANRALLEFISKQMGVQRSAVCLLSGETSRHKVVQVRGVTASEVAAKLLPLD